MSVASAETTSERTTVLSLPIELVREMFLYCAPTTAELETGPLTRLPPLVLTAVCHHWREIALSMPEIWSTIHLTIATHDSDAVPFIQRWLSRAQQQPLDISLSLVSSDHDQRLVELFESYRAQWKEIALKVSSRYLVELSATIPIPSIRRLSLDAFDTDADAETPQIKAFQIAPMLQHLTLGLLPRPSQLDVPYHQLTSLTFTKTRPEDLLRCLLMTPRLVKCVADVNIDSFGAPALGAIPASSLPKLEYFSLRGSNLTAYIIRLLTIPALASLGFTERGGLNAEDLTAISFFFERSSVFHNLRSLQLYFIRGAMTQHVLELLATLPGLEQLDFDATEAQTVASLFTKMLSIYESDSTAHDSFLPKLQSLRVTTHRKYDAGAHEMLCALCDVVTERCQTPELTDHGDFVFLSRIELKMEYNDATPDEWMLHIWRNAKLRGVQLNVQTRNFRRWV
ncbi:F-box domain-containing protein [Mycena indigotica]|uniref:F-box domain-containing protein n=1 Tax=Mycena indigotica TaxID=2126181 RepID=A0A8H6SER8_9AGAR|nr:F-box domain-containing protein [Mycena indigotica]KAF7297435.1 F-box domain-containing protein [Mycena indigotica]